MADYNSDRTGSNIDAVLDKADNLTQAAVGVGGNVGIGTANPSAPLSLNRTVSDGTILDFSKDGATVGSIRSRSGAVSTIILDPRAGGSGLTGTEGGIYPVNNEGGAADGLINLGLSNQRFRDLHLSGGVYLGGTGAVNKLDDYETGSWTPNVEGTSSVGTVAYTTRIARYVKVGNLVTATVRVAYNTLTGTGNLVITGLPFTASAYGVLYVGAVEFSGITYTGTPSALIGASDNKIKLEQYTSGGGATALPVDASGDIRINITYEVA